MFAKPLFFSIIEAIFHLAKRRSWRGHCRKMHDVKLDYVTQEQKLYGQVNR
jgi:hypothetical protein